MREEERGSPLQAPGITAPAIHRQRGQRPVSNSIPRIAPATADSRPCTAQLVGPRSLAVGPRPPPRGPISQGTIPLTTAPAAPAPHI